MIPVDNEDKNKIIENKITTKKDLKFQSKTRSMSFVTRVNKLTHILCEYEPRSAVNVFRAVDIETHGSCIVLENRFK